MYHSVHIGWLAENIHDGIWITIAIYPEMNIVTLSKQTNQSRYTTLIFMPWIFSGFKQTSLAIQNIQLNQAKLTAFLLITFVKAVWQSITLPGSWDAAPITAHEISRNITFICEVIPRQQLAFCNKKKNVHSIYKMQKLISHLKYITEKPSSSTEPRQKRLINNCLQIFTHTHTKDSFGLDQ